jgi:hypothetical protein
MTVSEHFYSIYGAVIFFNAAVGRIRAKRHFAGRPDGKFWIGTERPSALILGFETWFERFRSVPSFLACAGRALSGHDLISSDKLSSLRLV